jgi:hypothetical protein
VTVISSTLIPLRNSTSLLLKVQKIQERYNRVPFVAIVIPPTFSSAIAGSNSGALWDLDRQCLESVRETCYRYYPQDSQIRPLIYHGDTWMTNIADVRLIHSQLNFLSASIVDTEIIGDNIQTKLSIWKKDSRDYRQYPAISLSLNSMVSDWDDNRKCIANAYSEQDFFDSIANGVAGCYSAITALLADYYYWSRSEVPPQLPSIFPEILNDIELPSISLSLVDWVFDSYEHLYHMPFSIFSKEELLAQIEKSKERNLSTIEANLKIA